MDGRHQLGQLTGSEAEHRIDILADSVCVICRKRLAPDSAFGVAWRRDDQREFYHFP